MMGLYCRSDKQKYQKSEKFKMQKQWQMSAWSRQRLEKNGERNLIQQYSTFVHQHQKALSCHQIEEIKKIYPHGILGRNEQSNVVILDRIGVIKPGELAKLVDDDSFVSYIFQRLIFLAENVLTNKQKVVWIFDLAGKVMQLASKRSYSITQKIISQSQKYFPGMLHKLYFINTPMLFDTIWSKISDSIQEKTLAKMTQLTDDLEELAGDASAALLPEYLGGDQSDDILLQIDSIDNEREPAMGREMYDDEENQENQVDFNSLKLALSGLKLAGNHVSQSVAQTPLNTEADDPK